MELQEENGAWAQTIFTITPQENGTLREITEETQISGNFSAKLELDASNIIQEQKIESPVRHFIDPAELSRIPFVEVECQTYIQDIKNIHIPIELKDEASQTFYIGPSKAKATISKKIIPILKTGQKSQTIITFDGNYSQTEVIDQLFVNHDQKNHEITGISFDEDISQIEACHCLNYIIERVFWNSDPEEPIRENKTAETLTDIFCNLKTGKVISNQETQTHLACEPKISNSKLLDDYLEKKLFVTNFLEDCLGKGADDRIIIDDILDEILDNCSREIRFPFLDNGAQTLASYKTMNGGDDEDFLKKLRRKVAVDPEETKDIINLLMIDIIEAVFVTIAQEAQAIAKYVLCVLIRNSILTFIHLQEKRKREEPKPLDNVFIERKKKLAKRQKPETETIATQTKLAGVPEVKKLGDLMESTILCSACVTQSECRFCTENRQDFDFAKQTEIPQTQDILLTYKPCYFRSTMQNTKLPNVQIPQKSGEIREICSSSSCSITSINSLSTSSKSDEPMKKIHRKNSPSGWSDFDLSLWSTADSKSLHVPISTKSSSKSTSKISSCSANQYKSLSKSQCNLSPQTAIALKILKRTFCTRETCHANEEISEINANTFSDENGRKNKMRKQIY